MDAFAPTDMRRPGSPTGIVCANFLARALAFFAAAAARRGQRQALARLDRRLLEDIGVTARQARAECAKPLWR